MSRRLLLDTQVWLWWNAEPERLNAEVRAAIADGMNDVFLSAASAWEIAIKHALGKLALPGEPQAYVPSRLLANQIVPLSVHLDHVLRVGQLPPHHRDPFDRLLIAQAEIERLTLVTADPVFRRYNTTVIWAI